MTCKGFELATLACDYQEPNIQEKKKIEKKKFLSLTCDYRIRKCNC